MRLLLEALRLTASVALDFPQLCFAGVGCRVSISIRLTVFSNFSCDFFLDLFVFRSVFHFLCFCFLVLAC